MKVALVHDHLNQIGGAEKVLLAFHDLFPEAPIYTLIHDTRKTNNQFLNLDIRTSFVQNLPGGRRFFKWYLPLMPAAVEHFDLSGYDLVLSDSSALVKGVITLPQTLHICYCHTPTRYLWSDTHSYTEELQLPRFIKKFLPVYLKSLRMWDQLAAERVDQYLANSHFVAQRIKNYYHRDSIVIYPPVEVDRFEIADEASNYYLVISRLRPYKRVDLAIEAFNHLKLPLKIIGTGEEEKRLKKMAGPTIEFLGAKNSDEVRHYLARARALIHPQEEDFGIAAVEAMASGRPVIAYRRGGVLETVVSGKTGVFFDDQSWESLADTVIRFRPQDFDPRVIRQHAEQFSVTAFKEKIKNFIDQSYRTFRATNHLS